MDIALKYLEEIGYSNISTSYYDVIEQWINIWKGNAKWLKVKETDGNDYPMYSLGMAKRICEDLSSILTSEPYEIKASKNDNKLQELIIETKLFKKLPKAIEIMGYTGTVGSLIHIKNAEVIGDDENAYLKKTNKTKRQIINLKANQIIPLRIEDGEIIDCAFVSEQTRIIDNEQVNIVYLEIHILNDKGYQVTNKYFNKQDGSEIIFEGVKETYNTLSQQPLFSIGKLEKENVYDNTNGLGMALFGDSIDQLKILDLTYNNFGMDFKIGQKILVINKKLTRIVNEEYTDENGEVKTRQRVVYPSEIQKQLFTEMGNGIMDNAEDKPYIYEYNPDLRVGDNKDGIQFALDNLSFKAGYGTHYYSFENGNLTTATEAVLSRQDFVNNGNKNRNSIVEYLIKLCKALLLTEKMLGDASIDETQDIDIPDVDGFLEDEESTRERLKEDVDSGYISKKRYLMKVYGMTEEEALKELQEIEDEQSIGDIPTTDEDDTE